MRIAFLVLLLAAGCAHAQVYKWTDSNGKVHYGDRPPDEVKKQELKISVTTYDGPPQVRDWAKVIRNKAAAAPPEPEGITMFSADWCGVCKRAKRYFAAKGLSYTEINVETSEEGRRRFKELGGNGVPLILANGRSMNGFGEAAMDQMLRPR